MWLEQQRRAARDDASPLLYPCGRVCVAGRRRGGAAAAVQPGSRPAAGPGRLVCAPSKFSARPAGRPGRPAGAQICKHNWLARVWAVPWESALQWEQISLSRHGLHAACCACGSHPPAAEMCRLPTACRCARRSRWRRLPPSAAPRRRHEWSACRRRATPLGLPSALRPRQRVLARMAAAAAGASATPSGAPSTSRSRHS